VSVAGFVLNAVLVGISLQLRPDERNTNSLPADCEAAQALAHLDHALGGLESARVDVYWSPKVPSAAGEVLEVIGEVDQILRAEPLIGHPLSIHDLLAVLPGSGSAAERMSMLDLLPPPLKRAYYVPEAREASVSFRVQDLGIARYGPVFERVQAGLQRVEREHPEFSLELSGGAVWRWENLYQIVVDLATSLGTAALIIFGVLAVVYRSWRIGLISVIPNVFPLALTGTYLVLSGQALELVSVCAFTICLGIAVDDTIHFLSRYREEHRPGVEQQEAIRRAFTAVGTALVMTTVVLIAGFLTVITSDLRDHRIFAMMGTLTLGAALIGDLFILPALLACFARKST
jgi:predicted RND superfamily exporter protein